MRVHPRVLAALAALAVLAAPARAAELPGEPYGTIAMSNIFVPGTSVAERTAAYRRLADAGVRAIRLDVNWQASEPPGPPLGDFDFAAADREVAAITGAGLKVIGLLGYGHPDYSKLGAVAYGSPVGAGLPPFYNLRAEYFPPDDPEDFARFARAAAAHLGDEVIAWEVWNEENGGWRFWAPHEDPAAYGRLLCAAARATRAADPDTPVLFGGMFFPEVAMLPGQGAVRFLDNALTANPRLGDCFDAVAYHPYAYPFTAPDLDVPVRGSVLSAYDQLRAVLDRHKLRDRGLWITEVGWPTHASTYGVSETKQAQYLARTMLGSFAQGVPLVTWYTYGDYADPTGANQEAWFGLFRPDGSAKPAYQALRTLTATLQGSAFAHDLSRRLALPRGRLLLGGRGFALEFRGAARRVVALWLASESVAEGQGPVADAGPGASATRTVRLPVSSPTVAVVDYLGATRTVHAHAGHITVKIGPSPVYVVSE